jgi:hypothetical protein
MKFLKPHNPKRLMKSFLLSIAAFFALTTLCFAQGQVRDVFPTSDIYTIDYNSGQEGLNTSDDAVLFKDAIIGLVTGTNSGRSQLKIVPGKKNYVVTQVDPNQGYGFQIVYQTTFLRQTTPIYTFMYNVDQNTLYFFNPNTQNWVPEMMQGVNEVNLNNCLALSKFNMPAEAPQQAQDQPAQAAADDNTPVDDNVTATTIPPALPEYDQPECPQDGYLWQPGYWAYNPVNGYYWVPGAWVAPPNVGLLWTPPYWGYEGNVYIFHAGYWGNSIGFYGGINYGYGYGGSGYYGGEWRGGHFAYNTAVVRVSVNIRNVYVNRTVIVHNDNHYSFNGRGGVVARPNAREMQAMHQEHIRATSEQIRNQRMARDDRSQFASANKGRPTNFAVDKVPARTVNNNDAQRGNVNNPRAGAPGTNANNQRGAGTANAANNSRPGMPGSNGGQRSGMTGGAHPGMPGNMPGARSTMPGGNGARPNYNNGGKNKPAQTHESKSNKKN